MKFLEDGKNHPLSILTKQLHQFLSVNHIKMKGLIQLACNRGIIEVEGGNMIRKKSSLSVPDSSVADKVNEKQFS